MQQLKQHTGLKYVIYFLTILHIMFRKEKMYLAWNHPTTSQCTCRLT